VESRRVLILSEPGLLAQGMKSLLELDPRIEIVGVTADVGRAAEIMREQQPVVIILDADHFQFSLGHARGSIAPERVPTVIAFSQNDNKVRVCHVQERSLTAAKDLIEAVSG
jgi:chemotaxis response regulator CheB